MYTFINTILQNNILNMFSEFVRATVYIIDIIVLYYF